VRTSSVKNTNELFKYLVYFSLSMRLEVNVTKKRFFVILGAILLLSGMIVTYAYNADWASDPRDPVTYGHSPDELVGALQCGDGEALTITSTGWDCVSVGGGGSSGVSKINAGTGVTISPITGVGEVTINADGHVRGGLYGYCADYDPPGGPGVAYCSNPLWPAFCKTLNQFCSCPSGYTQVFVGMPPSTGRVSSCYKN